MRSHTYGGSHAYGTNVEGSDLDLRGVFIERENELLGLSNYDLFEDAETDTVIYGLRKIVRLLMNCNPNVLEILGASDDNKRRTNVKR